MILDTGIKDEVMLVLAKLAEKYAIEKVILFGSRARGDYRKTSDVDLAVTGGDVVSFSLDVENFAPTLLKFDIVDLGSTVQNELRESIKRRN